jgi:hypothetical protein
MELPSLVWWGIGGGVIGAATAAVALVMTLLSSKKKIPPPFIEVVEEDEKTLPAAFEITDLLISPSQIIEGETVTVKAEIRNIGGIRGNYSVALTLDDRIIGTRGVSLDPGSGTPVIFTINETQPGEHTVGVDSLKGSFIIPPAKFTISDLLVTPEHIKEGQKANVSVQLTNVGGITGSHLVELKVKGVTEMSQEVTLAPGSTQAVSFILSKKKTGFYVIQIGDLIGKLVVEMSDSFERI